MKKILIVAPYCSLLGEPNFNRFLYLYNMLSLKYDVVLLTSTFRHFDKTHRDESLSTDNIKLIHEPGYNKNVTLARVYSHKIFCVNFEKWLMASFDFDLVYSAYPLIETNHILSRFKKRLNFKLVIDVQDIWPESISSAFPLVDKFPLWILPFTNKANNAYASADALIAVSKTYLDRASIKNETAIKEVVYIGSDFGLINDAIPFKKSTKKFVLVYIGTLSYSYDVKTIVLAINRLYEKGFPIEFHIFGTGEFESHLKAISKANIVYHGFTDLKTLFSFMKSADVGVNALASSAKQSVTNKLSDFMSVGIPILNSQMNIEVLELLTSIDHENYQAGNVDDAEKNILKLYNRRESLQFRPNSLFNREIEYKKIVTVVERLVSDEC